MRAAGAPVLMDVVEEKPWTVLSTELTLAFPPGEEPDLSIVQRIRREFYPEYVPLWCRKVYRDPTGHEVVAGWHVIAEWSPVHDDPKPPVRVDLPPVPTDLFPFQGGVLYEIRGLCDMWAPGTRGARLGAPPDKIPYDMRVYHALQASIRFTNREFGTFKQKVLEQLDAQAEKERKDLEHVEEEARLSLRDDRHMIRRAIEQGKFTDPPKDPQPYVQAEKVYEGSLP